MPISNVKSEWVGGNLVFTAADGTTIATFDGTNNRLELNVVNVPADGRVLAAGTQAANVADVAVAAGAAPTKEEYDVAVAAINSIKDALVGVGILAPAV